MFPYIFVRNRHGSIIYTIIKCNCFLKKERKHNISEFLKLFKCFRSVWVTKLHEYILLIVCATITSTYFNPKRVIITTNTKLNH